MARILIISSKSGSGHQKATAALCDALEGDHELLTVSLYERSSRLYNSLVRLKAFTFIKLLYWLWGLREWFSYSAVKVRVSRAIFSWRPNVIISVSRGGNGAIWDACRKVQIPFVVVPTDLDVKPFLDNIKHMSQDLHVFLTDFSQLEQVPLLANGQVTGYPVQKCFLPRPRDMEKVFEEYGIEHMPGGIILMQGYDMAEDAKYLAPRLRQHEIVCLCNNNTSLSEKLHELEVDNVVVIDHASSETMANLMTAASVLVSKAGGSITGEAITLGLPVIVRFLEYPWEALNMQFLRTKGYGYYWPGKINGLDDLIRSISTKNPAHITRDFHKNVRQYIEQIVRRQ